jgi:four helix bundle protein
MLHPARMTTVTRFEDLDAWQLADELEQEIFAFTSSGPASRDFGFRDQIRDSIRSVKRNTAEGFGRFYPKEFLKFLRTAAGSLHETKNHLHDALKRRYIDAERHKRLVRINVRAISANDRLQAYLETCPTPRRRRR